MGIDFFEKHEKMLTTDHAYCEAYNALEQEFAIAHVLIKARTDAGMTQVELAEKMGISQPAIARMESGKNISLKTIAKYAKAVGHRIHFDILPA